ncbi:molecular chaperone DnaK [soil metagenome]
MPPPESSSTPILGIDLGTTNSLVAVAAWPNPHDAPRILPDAEGRALFPSLVRFNLASTSADASSPRTQNPPLVGPAAQPDPDSATGAIGTLLISSAKRLMGRRAADLAADTPFLPYSIAAASESDHPSAKPSTALGAARIALPSLDHSPPRLIAPEEVAALILAALRSQAARALDLPLSALTRAVITVPAYFDDAQRQATRTAARLAGLDPVRILAEPTAAALAYGLDAATTRTAAPRTIAVYDLGGGTFDISILRITPTDSGAGVPPAGHTPQNYQHSTAQPSANPNSDAFQVLATAGDTRLGGDDFDHAIIQHILAQFPSLPISESGAGVPSAKGESQPSPDLESSSLQPLHSLHPFSPQSKIQNPKSKALLLSLAQSAKHALTDLDSITIDLAQLDPALAPLTLTRETFDALISPLVERTLTIARRALRDARRALADSPISAIVMVGGSTRVPLVRAQVATLFGLTPYTAIDPDTVVALGAAVQGAILAGTRRDALLLDVVPLSLGIETAAGAFSKIIMRGSSTPAAASELFSTQVDNQTAITLHILQGEREMAADCRSLGTYHLRGIPPMPAGIPQLKVEFRVDASGVLAVSALERRSQRRLDVQIIPASGLSQSEIDRIERDSILHARDDMTRHRLADLLANSRLDLHWITRQLTRHGHLLPAAQRTTIESAITALQAFVSAAAPPSDSTPQQPPIDPDQFQRAKETLDRASIPLHELSIAESLRS